MDEVTEFPVLKGNVFRMIVKSSSGKMNFISEYGVPISVNVTKQGNNLKLTDPERKIDALLVVGMDTDQAGSLLSKFGAKRITIKNQTL